MSNIQASGPIGSFVNAAKERANLSPALVIPPAPPAEDATANAHRQQEEYQSGEDEVADARSADLDSNSEDDLVEDEDVNMNEDGGIRADMDDAISKGAGILELAEMVKKSKLSSQPQRIATLVPGGKQASLVINGDSLDRTRPVHWRFTPSTRVYGSHQTCRSYNVMGRSFRVESFKTPIRYICIPKTDFIGDVTQNWGFIGGKEHSVTLTIDHGQYLADPSLKFEFARAAVGNEKPSVPLLYAEYRPGLKSSQEVDAFDIEKHYIYSFKDLVTEKPHIAGMAKESLPADLQQDPLHDTLVMITFTCSGRITFLQSTKVVQNETEGSFPQIVGTIRENHDNVHIMIFTPQNPEEYAIHRSEHQAHWDLLIHHRFPPMSNFYDTDTMMPVLHLGLETVNGLHDYQYVNFGKVVNGALRHNYLMHNAATHPVDMDSAMQQGITKKAGHAKATIVEYPDTTFFLSREDFYIKFALGVIQEHQFTTHQAVHYESATHLAVVFAPFGTTNSEASKSLTSDQVNLRRHFFVFIRRGKVAGGTDLEDLPEGTAMLMDLSQHEQKPIERWWSGVIVENPLSSGTYPPHDFCMYMNSPYGSSTIPIQSRISDLMTARRIPVKLKAALDVQTEERELIALHDICLRPAHDVAAQTNTLVFQKEFYGDEKRDLRRGPLGLGEEDAAKNVALWERGLASMIKYEKLENNRNMIAAMNSCAEVCDRYTVFTGAAGTAKSRMSANLMVLQTLVGLKPVVVAKVGDAVDNIATAHDAARERALAEWKATEPELYAILSKLRHYRFEASGIPEAERIGLMVANLKGKDKYVSQSQADINIESDPIIKAMNDAIAALGHRAASDIDEFIEHASVVVNASAQLSNKKARKQRKYPMRYSVGWLLHNLKRSDIRGNTGLSTRFWELQDKLNKDKVLSTLEFSELKRERNNQIGRLLENCATIFTTISALGTDLFKACFISRNRILWIEEASQVSVPSSAVAMQYGFDAIFLSGDGNQLNARANSRGYNVAINFANKDILSLLQAKNVVNFELIMNYRLSPEIQKIARIWYSNMVASPVTELESNPIRQIMRKFGAGMGMWDPTHQAKDINQRRGATTFMMNVVAGVALRQENGVSLQNYAECDAVIGTAIHLVKLGIPLQCIGIITFYAGQKRLIEARYRLEVASNNDGSEIVPIEVGTADSSQGRTFDVTLVTFVASQGRGLKHFEAKLPNLYHGFTAYMRSSNRLLVSLSRGLHATIFFGNAESLVSMQRNKDGVPKEGPGSGREMALVMNYLDQNKLIYKQDIRDENPQLQEIGIMDDVNKTLVNLKVLNDKIGWFAARRRKGPTYKQVTKSQQPRAPFIVAATKPNAKVIPGIKDSQESQDRQTKGGVLHVTGKMDNAKLKYLRKEARKEEERLKGSKRVADGGDLGRAGGSKTAKK